MAAFVLLATTVAYPAAGANGAPPFRDDDWRGVPTFVTGPLGKLARLDGKAARDFLRSQRELLQLAGSEDFEIIGTVVDELGQHHFRLRETIRNLPVIGGEYVVHTDGNGTVLAINGRLIPDRDLPKRAAVDADAALQQAAAQAGIVAPKFTQPAELVYLVTDQSMPFLAWQSVVSYRNEEGPQLDIFYADAVTGNFVLRDPQHQPARYRMTYSGDGSESLPGRLVLTEAHPPQGDLAIQAAHDYAAVAYDYYAQVHGRNSWDDAGATLVSTAHHGQSVNNAFWWNGQTVYGDGDGWNFRALSLALDIVTHEWTHAVTERTANLTYAYESGALNEATSDILGTAAEVFARGISENTWKLGEDAYTPYIAGDALRYLNDPAAGGDYDYYPERYTGTADNGGVHWNSGIANLAFYLMVAGGYHPRGKTSVYVPPLSSDQSSSMAMGERIWYRALRVYMTSSTNFQGARNATAQAALDIYGSMAAATVHKAWDAVGVPGSSFASNPFTYARGRDQYLACYGIAGRISSNCRDIADANDKAMCYAMSDRTQSPCWSITDRNLQLACFGMSIRWGSNCRDITDPNMRNFCYGVSYQNYNYCYNVTDRNTQLLCYAMSNGISSNCRDISNSNDRNFCYGVSSLNNSYCAYIQQ